MTTILTRCVRSNLLKTTQDDLSSLKEELIHDEVINSAIQFHSILKVIDDKYSNDAVVDLIPKLTQLFNKLDAALKVSEREIKATVSVNNKELQQQNNCVAQTEISPEKTIALNRKNTSKTKIIRYKNLIEKLKTPSIIAVTIPYRFDMHNSHKVNYKTFLVNWLLKHLEEEVPKMKIVDTESMDRKYFTRHGLHFTEKGKDALSRLIADCISENSIATPSDKRISDIKEIAVANSPYTGRIEPCVLSPPAANEAIATELIEEQNTPSCSLVGATYADTMKGDATQSPSIRPSEAFKPSSKPGAQVSSSSIDIASLSSQSPSGFFLETRQVHSPTT
ncbi:hypothetical protein J6590_087301 [Homalodisca vitripennis]|nr:hypothetical protein J6590_087301 [Homalodisca vitripennis]